MRSILRQHSIMYCNQPNQVEIIGSGETEAEAIEALRKHLLACNQRLIELQEVMEVPECIVKLATASVKRNPHLDIVVREDGIVFIDGQGPEMDWYTITN